MSSPSTGATVVAAALAVVFAGSNVAHGLYLGQRIYGHVRPDLNEDALNVAGQCPLAQMVRPGDTCMSVATSAQVSLQQLTQANVAMNPSFSCDSLVPGVTLLCIPQPDSATYCLEFYTTKPDDTCQGITAAFGITMDQLTQLNSNIQINCAALAVGEQICVEGFFGNSTVVIGGPAPTSSSSDDGTSASPTGTASTNSTATSSNSSATVTPGPSSSSISPVDGCTNIITATASTSCSELATDYDVSFTDLAKWNWNFDCQKLVVGDKICVKAPAGDTVSWSHTIASTSQPTPSSSIVSGSPSTSATATSDNGNQPSSTEQQPQPTTSSAPPPDNQPTSSDEWAALNMHNSWRSRENMPSLSWSNSLAASAANWANTLASQGCSIYHSGTPGIGENIFMSGGGDVNNQPGMDAAVSDWMTEPFGPGDGPNHATQVLWATTYEVGCGKAINPAPCEIVVCQYMGPGNWGGENWWDPSN